MGQLEKLKQDLSEEQPHIEEKPKKNKIDKILVKIEKYQKKNEKKKLKKLAIKVINNGKKYAEILKDGLQDKNKLKELEEKVGSIMSQLKQEKSEKIEEKPLIQESPKEEIPETTITEEVQIKPIPCNEVDLNQDEFAKFVQLSNICILADTNKLKLLIKSNPSLSLDDLVSLAFDM